MRFSRKEEFRRQLERPAFIAGNGDEWEGRTNEIGAEEGAKSPGHRQNHEDSGSQEQVGPISPEDHSGVISSVDALLDDYRAVALYSHRTTEGLYKHLRRKVMSGFSQLDDEGTTSQVPSIERSANEALGVVHNEPCNADGQQSPPDNTIGSSPNEVAHHPLKHPEVVSESDHMRVCDAGTRTADVISHLNTDIEPASDQSCAAAQENARVNADFWTTTLLSELIVHDDVLIQQTALRGLIDHMAFHSNRSIYNTLNVLLNAPGDSFLSWATVSRRSLKFDNADDDEVLAKLKRLVEQLESPFDFVRLQGLHGLNNAKRALDDWFVAKTLYPLLQISLGKTPNPTVRAVYYSLKSYAEDYYTLYTQLKDDQAYRNLLTSSLLDNSTPLRERRRIVEEPSNTGRISEHDILLQLRILGSSLSTKVSGILHPIVNAVTTILSQSPDDDFRHGMHWLFNAYNLGYEEVSTSQISLRRKADFHCYIVNFPKPMINPGNRNIHRPDINAHKTLEIPSISGNGHFVDGCKVFEIPSVLGSGHLVNALGDYCAKRNFMKEEYAKQLRLQIDRQATSSVTIGSGKQVVTTGVVKTSFRFKDEKHEYSLLFHILPSCVHDVILGKGFLKITKTFSNLANKARRVKERLMKGMPLRHLLYLGESAPRFQGLINGVPQEALADSGSKVMVMDENYAEEMGLRIVRGSNHQTRLRFADGSTSLTSGMALGVEWEFGRGGVSDRFLLDFHILKNAPANVILSDQFLFGTEAFSHYECFLVDDDDEDDDEAFFFAIDVDETSPGQVHLDMSSLSNKQHAETVLRGEKEDEIANLPRHQQAEAWRRELERRGRWEQDFAALQLCLSTLMQTNSTSLSSSSSSTSGASAQLLIPVPTTITKANTAGMKRPKWRLKFRRKSST